MNRYPVWKYVVIAVAIAFGLIYTLPNFFGESPAVQVSSGKATVKVDEAVLKRVESSLEAAKIPHTGIQLDGASIKVRLQDPDTQLKARDALIRALNPDTTDPTYIVALNLLSASPQWLASLRALPMYLGLDLRGGVHFLLQVDMKAALNKRIEATVGELRGLLRDKNIRHAGIVRNGDAVEVRFRDEASADRARTVITDGNADLDLAVVPAPDGGDRILRATLKSAAERTLLDTSVQQNVTTLNNRINELGVSEPVIARQGADRIVVQLPGVQDTARAKDILGRTATLEARLVDLSAEAQSAVTGQGAVPFGSELFRQGRGAPVVLRKQAIFTGEQLSSAAATFDERQQPAVAISLNDAAGRVLREVSRENIKKPMAIVLFERGRGEVLTVATIQSELGSRFQITGMESPQASNDLALLLRAGALAAPMEIIEERTIGPSLGAENIRKGFNSTLYGFIAIAVFMIAYYLLMGVISTIALAINVLLLIALLSLLQATLTLPGIAAIALTLGMAIDANVLINERIREELRNGATPQAALATGYERAWGTILDSNITTLIAGVALLVFGSGPVRGFAVVHCLGILTSMFSAVVVSRGMVNLWYGRQKKLSSISIGQVWKPKGA
ncbi:MAG: protein translocase subunit SecD [Burkholderiaceae bacterium]|nr:protein translocase subunit SecD [Burkholderiales bacterium]MCZ8339971.1 protein translocase subunit SecD [Burkholderiaceae bacterium]